jgi:Ni2+-binding GTPase involved in maturation of urease and hydrogenase
MVGGFLGAGKTTALARLGRHYEAQGQKVGLVTNDQAQDLVDTNSLRAQGFSVAEVPGACFCCRFNDLIGKMEQLQVNEPPDVILAEPVGSCTDLVATVVQPLRDLYGRRFHVAPYVVLFKPSHGLPILRNETDSGFSQQAAYIFRKQLEEADAIVINRIDELSIPERQELATLVATAYPGTPILQVSAKTGEGFEGIVELLDQEGNFGSKILDIDYDVYAQGEAEMGWLNSRLQITAATPFALDDFLLEVVNDLRDSLLPQDEIAHLKVIALCEGSFGVANLISSHSEAELSLPSRSHVRQADVIINARVAMDPALLEQEARRAVEAACLERHGRVEFRKTQSLRPGRPTPTYRYATAK